MTRIALFLLCLTSGFASAADVAGNYALRGVMEVGSELSLNPDGTFEYMLAYGAADYFAKGTWRRDGDSVVLNTAGRQEPPFRLVKSSSTKAKVLRVWVKAPNGRAVEHIEVVLQNGCDESLQKTSAEGVAMFPEPGAAKSIMLRVPVYHVEAGPYPLEPAHNDYVFEINGEAITQVRFKDERLKINGKDLELRYWDPDRAMRYERQ